MRLYYEVHLSSKIHFLNSIYEKDTINIECNKSLSNLCKSLAEIYRGILHLIEFTLVI